MVQDTHASLKKERNDLVNEYVNASAKDKISILVRIMDLDERIEDISDSVRNTAVMTKTKMAR